MLQTNNTGVRSQCLSHTGSALAHGACSLPAHTAWDQSEASPGLHVPQSDFGIDYFVCPCVESSLVVL